MHLLLLLSSMHEYEEKKWLHKSHRKAKAWIDWRRFAQNRLHNEGEPAEKRNRREERTNRRPTEKTTKTTNATKPQHNRATSYRRETQLPTDWQRGNGAGGSTDGTNGVRLSGFANIRELLLQSSSQHDKRNPTDFSQSKNSLTLR